MIEDDRPWCPAHGRYSDALAGCPDCKTQWRPPEDCSDRSARPQQDIVVYINESPDDWDKQLEIKERLRDEIANSGDC